MALQDKADLSSHFAVVVNVVRLRPSSHWQYFGHGILKKGIYLLWRKLWSSGRALGS